MAKSVVGLEITEESVRAVEVTTGRTPTMIAAGEVPLPAGAAKDSEVLDQDAVVLSLKQLWTRSGIKGRKVVLGIGSRRILVREYTTQALRPDILKQALPFQVQDLLPVPVNQAVLDFYPVSQVGDQVSGLLVAAVSETVEALIATLRKAKLQVDAVDLVPFGLARVARRLGAPGETVAMVHVGDHTSYVVVVLDGIPRFVRIIPIDVPTGAVRMREQTQLSAESLDPALVTVPPQAPRGRAAIRTGNAADPTIADLVSRLRSTISFYSNRPDAAPVTSVFLSGAGAVEPEVLTALNHALDSTVRVVSASDVVKTSDDVVDEFRLNAVSTIGVTLEGGY
ncbi:pilus assembly protein PilM [Microbacterium lacus]|uniref:type IV pilus biogenesis protein PilM n=1 Tax=Microbacterium lacus TaxID=415217 RepID=UPI00384D670A